MENKKQFTSYAQVTLAVVKLLKGLEKIFR